MITLAEYIELVKQAEQASVRRYVQPDNQSDKGPIAAETTADEAVQRAKSKIPKAAEYIDHRLDVLKAVLVKQAVGMTIKGITSGLSPTKGMMNTGRNLGKQLSKGTLTPPKPTVGGAAPAMGANKVNAGATQAGVTLNIGDAKLKPTIKNNVSFRSPPESGISPTGKTGVA